MIHVVTGAPCSGKTTFVNEHKRENDVVIDLDSLAVALGASNRYDYHGDIREAAFAARNAAIAAVGDSDAWIVHSQPTDEQRAEYGDAVFHDLDPGREECVNRARNDDRPP